MELQQAIKQGERFMVAVDRGELRCAAELYTTETGVVFLDTGWPEPMAPPRAHYMAGTPRETPMGWEVGDWRIYRLDTNDPEDREAWTHWERGKEICEEYGLDYSREEGARYATRVLEIPVKP
ncbi:MAG: hypothetical protein ACOC0M_00370 [Halomonas sp.]